VLLKQASPLYAYYYRHLQPGVHYLPFYNSSKDDILAVLDWLQTHDEEARRIGQQGREFALQKLSRRARLCYMWELFKRAAALRREEPSSSPSDAAPAAADGHVCQTLVPHAYAQNTPSWDSLGLFTEPPPPSAVSSAVRQLGRTCATLAEHLQHLAAKQPHAVHCNVAKQMKQLMLQYPKGALWKLRSRQ